MRKTVKRFAQSTSMAATNLRSGEDFLQPSIILIKTISLLQSFQKTDRNFETNLWKKYSNWSQFNFPKTFNTYQYTNYPKVRLG